MNMAWRRLWAVDNEIEHQVEYLIDQDIHRSVGPRRRKCTELNADPKPPSFDPVSWPELEDFCIFHNI